jgi:GT2 family glycosyltransferase
MPPILTVLTATLDRRELLGRLLESLGNQDAPEDSFDIVVVDNGSRDGTWEWLQRLSIPNLRVLREEKRGAAAARNRGLREAQGERVLFLDDDMEPAPDLVRRHLDAHQFAPEASFLGLIEFPWKEHPEPLLRYLAQIQAPALFPFRDGEPVPFMHYYTAHVSSPREALERVGGFDEGLGPYGYEDTDLGFRLEKAGVPMRFLAGARAVNRDVPSPEAHWAKVRKAGAAKAALLKRRPELRKVFRRATWNRTFGWLLDLQHLLLFLPAGPAFKLLHGRKDLPAWARRLYALKTKHQQSLGWRDYQRSRG